MMRVCDLIAEFVYGHGIKDVFTVVGGGSMFLIDGLACNKDISVYCCHHEQAAAMAAVSYAKYNGKGCAYLTTGCGGTNAVTGVLHAWQDNVRCMFISGQCRRNETVRNLGLEIRQLGVQEADIVEIVGSITKYAVMINDPDDILYELEKAYSLMNSGRPGPVWIDVPIDVQSSEVDEDKLHHFEELQNPEIKPLVDKNEISNVFEMIKKSIRPIIIAGQGVRIAEACEELREVVHKNHIPVVFSRLGIDLLPDSDECCMGPIGNQGTRAANIAVQNSDCIISIGSRLSICSTGYGYEYFGREAKIIAVDIDPREHSKDTINIDKFIHMDAKDFLCEFIQYSAAKEWLENTSKWLLHCNEVKKKYPRCLPELSDDSNGISMYYFCEKLSDHLSDDDVVVTDAGSAVYVPPQALRLSSYNQRYITSGGQAEMGFSMPGTVGIAVARGGSRRVIGITGEGSLQMNIQEMQTIVQNNLCIKMFVWNNGGYLSMKSTQTRNFNRRFLGMNKESGVSFPDLRKISDAYGIKYLRIDKSEQLDALIQEALDYPGAVICEVMCDPDESVQPVIRIKKRKENGDLVYYPLEEMSPLIPRDELKDVMFIDFVED